MNLENIKFKALEVDLLRYFQWNSKELKAFHAFIKKHRLKVVPRLSLRMKREISEYEDLFQIWNEKFGDQTLYYSIYSGKKKWDPLTNAELKKLPKKLEYFFEWGQDDTAASTDFLTALANFAGLVIDPHWHSKHLSKLKSPLRFKLHGWNEERWVRRYGVQQSALIMKRISKYQKSSLVLSYSGKQAEQELFSSVDCLVLNF